MVGYNLSICNYVGMRQRLREIDETKLIEFGRNLCAERNRSGLSQDGLGNLISKDGRYIGAIERGEVNPTLTTIILLLEALNIPFEALVKLKKD